MRVLKKILSLLPFCVLWLMASVFLWGFVFGFLTDAPAEKKVVLFADVPALRDKDLALRLEEDKPEGIKLVQVHPFSYAMFGAEELTSADLYIIPESHMERFRDGFAPLGDAVSMDIVRDDLFISDGQVWGVRIRDASKGTGAASSYVTYPEEDCYLCLGAKSRHLGEINGSADDAALVLARVLVSLP